MVDDSGNRIWVGHWVVNWCESFYKEVVSGELEEKIISSVL